MPRVVIILVEQMQLYYWRGTGGIENFGDALNPWIWSRRLPGLLDETDDEIVVGIGTLINDRVPRASRVHVLGSGVGYGALPRIDNSWCFHAVRGPESARALNLASHYAVIDPGVLVREYVDDMKFESAGTVGYMPHWQSRNSRWPKICAELDFAYIDPTNPVEQVLAMIGGCKLLITEAMHGAIVADALRVPWIPVRTEFPDALGLKWLDWCRSVELEAELIPLPRLWGEGGDGGVFRSTAKRVIGPIRAKEVKRILCRVANEVRPQLSSERILNHRIRLLQDAIDRFADTCRSGS